MKTKATKTIVSVSIALFLCLSQFSITAHAAIVTLMNVTYPTLVAVGQQFTVTAEATGPGYDPSMYGADTTVSLTCTDLNGTLSKPNWPLPVRLSDLYFSSSGTKTITIAVSHATQGTASTNININVVANKSAAPAASVDYVNEKITGLEAGKNYIVHVDGTGGGDAILPASGTGTIDIHSAWMNGTNNNFQIYLAGDGSTYVDSETQTLTIPARPAAPAGLSAINATTVGGTGGINGTTTAMEYSANANGPWTDCTAGSTNNLAQGTYYVRAKTVVNTDFASEQTQVIIAAATGKDITAFSINGVNGTISGTAITINVPYGTNKANLTPTITHTGASISPASGVAQDFTNPVTYTVTAGDGSTKDYTVTVSVKQPPSALPKTGDGFPMGELLALLGCCMVALGWLGLRMRGGLIR